MNSISSLYTTASNGLNSASISIATTAGKIAGFGTGEPGTDDLADNEVHFITDKITYEANARILKSAHQILGTILDVIDSPLRS